MLIAALTVMYIILGTALDGISMIVLTTVVVLPMVQKAGFDLVCFGIFLVLIVEMAEVSPPVRLQPVRAANHERPRQQLGGEGGSAVLLPSDGGGRYHHRLPGIVMWLPKLVFPDSAGCGGASDPRSCVA